MKYLVSFVLILSLLLPTVASCGEAVGTPSSERGTDTDRQEEESDRLPEKKPAEKDTEKTSDKKEESEMKDPASDGVLKILTIGNSFSDDTMQYVYEIAKSAGFDKIRLGNLYIGGCTLSTHASNARANRAAYDYRTNYYGKWHTEKDHTMKDAIASENWDFISLQQASGSSGIAESYSELEYMIEYVSSHAPSSALVWNMTWAYQQDSDHGEFYKYGNDQLKMYESIISAVRDRVYENGAFARVIPNGTAIQNARTSYVGDTLTRDGYHLSTDLGRYIAGLTLFCSLTGRSPADVAYMPDGVDVDIKKIADEAVANAIASPLAISNSAYTERPVFDESLYELLELDITPLAYWNSMASQGLDTASSNRVSYAATRLFQRDEIPVGSVIVIAQGWRYRPEAWVSAGAQSSRPDNVTAERITVSEDWWGNYTWRAFNISKSDGSSLEGLSAEQLAEAFRIYVPKEH